MTEAEDIHDDPPPGDAHELGPKPLPSEPKAPMPTKGVGRQGLTELQNPDAPGNSVDDYDSPEAVEPNEPG